MVEMGGHEAAQRLDTNSQESRHPTIRILASINIVFYGVSRDIRDPDIGDLQGQVCCKQEDAGHILTDEDRRIFLGKIIVSEYPLIINQLF